LGRAVAIDPDFWLGWLGLAQFCSVRGQFSEALPFAEKAIARAPWGPVAIGATAAALRNVGRGEDAEAYLAQSRADAYGGPVGLAAYHMACGELDQAVEWLSKAVDQRYTIILITMLRPFEPLLHQCAGWPALLKKMNLPIPA